MRRFPLYLTALVSLSAALVVTSDGFVHAADRQSDQAYAIRQCAAIHDDSHRLACFDRLAQGLAPTPDGASQHTDRQTTRNMSDQKRASKGDSFGLPAQPSTARDDSERHSVIATAQRKVRGAWVLTMENEQMWEQTDTARISPPSPGDAVTIAKSTLGGFFVTINGRSFRAKRIR